jgi:hypothetical protein
MSARTADRNAAVGGLWSVWPVVVVVVVVVVSWSSGSHRAQPKEFDYIVRIGRLNQPAELGRILRIRGVGLGSSFFGGCHRALHLGQKIVTTTGYQKFNIAQVESILKFASAARFMLSKGGIRGFVRRRSNSNTGARSRRLTDARST